MVSIEEGLFTIRLYPHLIFAVLGEVVKARNVKLEFAWFWAEFSKASSSADQIIFLNMCRELQHIGINIVDSGAVESENVFSIFTFDQKLDVRAQELGKFLKESLGFLDRKSVV